MLNSSRNFLTKLIVVRVTEDQMDEDTKVDHRFYSMVRRIKMRKYESEGMQKIRKPVFTWEILEQEMDEFLLEDNSNNLDLNIQNVSFAETDEAPSDLIFPLLRCTKRSGCLGH